MDDTYAWTFFSNSLKIQRGCTRIGPMLGEKLGWISTKNIFIAGLAIFIRYTINIVINKIYLITSRKNYIQCILLDIDNYCSLVEYHRG